MVLFIIISEIIIFPLTVTIQTNIIHSFIPDPDKYAEFALPRLHKTKQENYIILSNGYLLFHQERCNNKTSYLQTTTLPHQ